MCLHFFFLLYLCFLTQTLGRNIKASPEFYICDNGSPAFLNRAVHWIGYYHNHSIYPRGVREMVMVLFDMGDEVFREVKLPNDVARKRRALLELKVSELGKSL